MAESDTDVDTSSITSTFVSFGKKAAETGASVLESSGDALAGTTIYLEAMDENENSNRVVAIQRGGAFGEIAGMIVSGTIADTVVAAPLGQTRGSRRVLASSSRTSPC